MKYVNYGNTYEPQENTAQAKEVTPKDLVTINNVYVKRYKSVVEKFLAKARQIVVEQERNNERYQVEVAKKENEILQAQLNSEYTKANSSIVNTFNEVRTCLSLGAFPNVESLTADRMFFDGQAQIDISEQEMQSFVERYTDSGNFVMLRIIAKYIDKANRNTKQNGRQYMDAMKNIHLPDEHLQVYKMYGEGALSLIDTIYNNPKDFSDWTLASYAEAEFGEQYMRIIGTGSNLTDYKTRRLPESAQHSFDDVTLTYGK